VSNGHDNRGDNLVVYNNGHSHCFACGYHVFPKYGPPRKIIDNAPKSLRPTDYTREVPSSSLGWLLQYGLPYTYWKEYLGYSEEKGRRLIFDVGQPLAFSIGRLLDEPTKTSRKWYVWGDCHKHCQVFGEHYRSDRIVLVEDLISGHKVGQVNETVVLFGTEIHPSHYHYLINRNKPVVFWLDKDQEQNVKAQALRLQSIINQPVNVVTTNKDPKELSYEAIRSATQQQN
jgi:hypothetical protein